MSDTPRTDVEAQTCMDTSSEWHGEWVRLDFARQLERELDAANERMKRLEEAGNEVVWWFCQIGSFSSTQSAALKQWKNLRWRPKP